MRKICLGKLSSFFHFFIALIFEGVIVKESFRRIVLDTEDLCPQGSYNTNTNTICFPYTMPTCAIHSFVTLYCFIVGFDYYWESDLNVPFVLWQQELEALWRQCFQFCRVPH